MEAPFVMIDSTFWPRLYLSYLVAFAAHIEGTMFIRLLIYLLARLIFSAFMRTI